MHCSRNVSGVFMWIPCSRSVKLLSVEGSPPWSIGVPGISQPVGRISEGSVRPDDGFSRARDERWQEQVSPRRAVGSWRGKMWITKQEYDECGPSIVHRKCF